MEKNGLTADVVKLKTGLGKSMLHNVCSIVAKNHISKLTSFFLLVLLAVSRAPDGLLLAISLESDSVRLNSNP